MQFDVNQLPGGYIQLDETNTVTSVNQPMCDWLGRSMDSLIGRAPESWMTVASRMYYLGHVLPSLRLHRHAEEILLTFSSNTGEPLPVILNAAARPKADGGFLLLILPMQRRNLVEEQLQKARKTAEQATIEKEQALNEVQTLAHELELRQVELTTLNTQLEQMATQDVLTGLNNRRVYEREIEIQLASYQRTHRTFTLILTDIDWFKHINDQFGHDAGDRVLKDVSHCLQQGMRNVDILARMGGEEFSLLLPSTSAEQAILVAERKRQDIENMTTPYGTVTMSFGIADAHPGDKKGDIYGRADKAMYAAKSKGRNRVCVG
ncbi:GGDEF domain-containing protein [Saccharospirillum impatiens]|jgi:sigma-B regulation protein RsbU (phosphoserine phosphatase)|uniref:GGDEF domain-containing protein n=1 Tax=Saccharospirillum impatiens TaxID=169438 RepID=UPI00041BEC70|nr:sensor domain-containing diguanylate cyclase [Saccharospirillum impatiens]